MNSYFEEINEVSENSTGSPNFRLNYNSNSGGGQAFLPGKFLDDSGALVPAASLEAEVAVFQFLINERSQRTKVYLDDPGALYEIRPRAFGNQNMKLGVANKINPGLVISAFLMLPPTCSIQSPHDLNISILARENFWLQTMNLEVSRKVLGTGSVALIVKSVVFAGGKSKRQSSEVAPRLFRLDFEKRIIDILHLSDRRQLPHEIQVVVDQFAAIYRGERKFLISDCEDAVRNLMRELSSIMPEEYSGVMDPLPFLKRLEDTEPRLEQLSFDSGYRSEHNFPHNWIVWGAPGTGKSYSLENDASLLVASENQVERVTFHPDYSYAQFVGTYKPVPVFDKDGRERISYRFVPGPFMRVLVEALKSIRAGSPVPHLLIVEEINRANTAAVFGDIFQLLDRNEKNVSQFAISPSEDMRSYISQELGLSTRSIQKIKIPDNMYIWATMNSADQGVHVLDTAFKRRWAFKYVGVDENDSELENKWVDLGMDESQEVEWNSLRRSINDFLASKGVNEDKQLGPYFLSRDIVIPASGIHIETDKFVGAFSDKVMMYLYEDAARHLRSSLFEGSSSAAPRYSELVGEFSTRGVDIFNSEITASLKEKGGLRRGDEGAKQ